MLALAGLALAELDGHACGLEAPTNRAEDVLILGGLQDVVILQPRRVRFEVAVTLVVGLVVGVLEQVELDLAGHHRQEAHLGGRIHLRLQNAARGHLHQVARVDVE